MATTEEARLPYAVGLVDDYTGQCRQLRRFKTEAEASTYIATLPGYEDGRYYLDGPEEAHK